MIQHKLLMMSVIGMKYNRGVTLLEMIAAFSLIALILGIFFVRSRGVREQRSINITKGDLRAIQTAINSYYLHHSNTYPSGSDWLNNDLAHDDTRVLRQVLYDPFRATPNTEYSYYTSSGGKYYVVFSYGPDQGADITGINTSGKLTGANDDDIFITNGTGSF